MRYDNGTIYPPDNLAYPVVYTGDPAIQGVLGQPTLATLNDVWGGSGGAPQAQQIANQYGGIIQESNTPTSDDPCSRYDKADYRYWLCKGTDIGTGGIGGKIFNQGQDAVSSVSSFGSDIVNRAGLFLLALLVLGVGLWAALK